MWWKCRRAKSKKSPVAATALNGEEGNLENTPIPKSQSTPPPQLHHTGDRSSSVSPPTYPSFSDPMTAPSNPYFLPEIQSDDNPERGNLPVRRSVDSDTLPYLHLGEKQMPLAGQSQDETSYTIGSGFNPAVMSATPAVASVSRVLHKRGRRNGENTSGPKSQTTPPPPPSTYTIDESSSAGPPADRSFPMSVPTTPFFLPEIQSDSDDLGKFPIVQTTTSALSPWEKRMPMARQSQDAASNTKNFGFYPAAISATMNTNSDESYSHQLSWTDTTITPPWEEEGLIPGAIASGASLL